MMTEQRIFFPVGSAPSVSYLDRFSWQQLQSRELNDPAFAVKKCDPTFDWHDYIQVNIKDKETLRQVTATLDQFAHTPEGQASFRQAAAMQNYRVKIGKAQGSSDGNPVKIIIEEPTRETDISSRNAFDYFTGKIMIDLKSVRELRFPNEDRNLYQVTLHSVIFHELGHAKDALLGVHTSKEADGILKNKSGPLSSSIPAKIITNAFGLLSSQKAHALENFYRAEDLSNIYELPAIIDTNHFMKKYYGEAARALTHFGFVKGDIEKSKAASFLTSIKNQPNSNGNSYYDEMPSPPRVPCLAKTPMRGVTP